MSFRQSIYRGIALGFTLWGSSAFPLLCPRLLAQNSLPAGTYLLRDHPALPLFETLDIEEFQETKDLVRRVYRRRVHQGSPSPLLKMKEPLGFSGHFSQIEPIVKFATDYYRDRRHWPETFIDKIWSGSRSYLNDTIYMELLHGPERDRVGTMRFVMAPFSLKNGWRVARGSLVRELYGAEFESFRDPNTQQPDNELPKPPLRLPAADYLGIDFVPVTWRGEGIEWEAGANAIKVGLAPELHAQVQSLQWLQYLELNHGAFSDMLNLFGTSFYTFGDKLSDRLNLPLGYQHVLRYVQQGKLIAHAKGPIQFPRDGIDWTAYAQHPIAAIEVATKASERFKEEDGKGFLARRVLRDSERVGGRAGFKLSATSLIVTGLSSEDEDERNSAIGSIHDLAAMQMLNVERLKEEVPRHLKEDDPVLAINARIAAFLYEVLEKLRLMLKSPSSKDRATVSRVMAALASVPTKRNLWLNDWLILNRFVGELLIDEDESIAQATYQWVKFTYRPEQIVGVWGQEDIRSSREMQTYFSKVTKEKGITQADLEAFLKMKGHQAVASKLRELAKRDQPTVRALAVLRALSEVSRDANPFE